MSIKLMASVWEDDSIESRADLLVLLIIADASRDEGGCWPSIDTIARKARLSQRGAQDCIAKLKNAGKLEVEYGAGPRGTNVYRVVEGGAVAAGVQPVVEKVVGQLHPNRKEPEGIVKEQPPKSPKGEGDRQSEEIYEAYPRKAARRAAIKAIHAARRRGHPPDFLLQKTKEYAASCKGREERYIPYPATWFNQDRFFDHFTPYRSSRSELLRTIEILTTQLRGHAGNPDNVRHNRDEYNDYLVLQLRLKQLRADLAIAQ